jgi:putative tricarboxylic transport membrane protein
MKRSDAIAHIFLIAFGVVLSLMAFKLGLGALSDPGPGFLPFYTGVLISLLSVLDLGRLTRLVRFNGDPAAISPAVNYKRAVYVVLILLFYSLLLEKLGYPITTFLAMLLLFSIYERKRWWTAAVGSIMVTGITYVVFYVLLNVQLPVGFLGLRG